MKKNILNNSVELLSSALEGKQPADQIIQKYFRAHPNMGMQDRGFAAETVYGCLRRKRSLEYSLGEHSPTPMHLIAAYLVATQGWSARALEEAGFKGARDLVTRLRKADIAAIPPAVRADLPDWLYERLAAQLGEDETQQLATALNQPAPVDLRVNTLKLRREEAAARLAEAGYPTELTPYSPIGLRRHDRAPLFNTHAYKEGLIEVQDEGSQLLSFLLSPKRSEMVVDFCAGAGGKTLHLGALMGNTGTLYAFDTSEKRLAKMKPRLKRAGLDTVRSVVIEHERDRRVQRLRGKIDRVLVDAPCTGLGTLRRNPDLKWRPADLKHLTDLQGRILTAAAALLKPGGQLVYATCSPLREENDAVVNAFLESHPEFSPLPVSETLARKGIVLPGNNESYLRLYTHRHHTDCFFAALLQRQR